MQQQHSSSSSSSAAATVDAETLLAVRRRADADGVGQQQEQRSPLRAGCVRWGRARGGAAGSRGSAPPPLSCALVFTLHGTHGVGGGPPHLRVLLLPPPQRCSTHRRTLRWCCPTARAGWETLSSRRAVWGSVPSPSLPARAAALAWARPHAPYTLAAARAIAAHRGGSPRGRRPWAVRPPSPRARTLYTRVRASPSSSCCAGGPRGGARGMLLLPLCVAAAATASPPCVALALLVGARVLHHTVETRAARSSTGGGGRTCASSIYSSAGGGGWGRGAEWRRWRGERWCW